MEMMSFERELPYAFIVEATGSGEIRLLGINLWVPWISN